MLERRAFIRLPEKLTAAYKLSEEQPGGDDPVHSLTKDVSGGGVRIATAIQFALQTVLEVEVKFPDRSEPVKFKARVAWSRPLVQTDGFDHTRRYETGLQFMEISREDQKYVNAHAALNSPRDRQA